MSLQWLIVFKFKSKFVFISLQQQMLLQPTNNRLLMKAALQPMFNQKQKVEMMIQQMKSYVPPQLFWEKFLIIPTKSFWRC